MHPMNRRLLRRLPVALAAVSLLAVGCGSDSGTAAPAEPPATTDTPSAGEAGGEPLTVRGVDYRFVDLPSQIEAGTTVTLVNDSDQEVHEILAFRLNDDETRGLDELLQLPEEELMRAMELRGVALAPPGEDSTGLPVPPLTVEQPGRYVFACFIPTDAPPDEVMAAVAAFVESGETEGAPAYPETGPPHAVNGMIAEVTVTS